MSEGPYRDIALRLATGFAAHVEAWMPHVEKAVRETGQKVSFSVTVSFRPDKGVVVGQMVPHEPKIPQGRREATNFVLRAPEQGEFAFGFEGTVAELEKAIEEAKDVGEDVHLGDASADDPTGRDAVEGPLGISEEVAQKSPRERLALRRSAKASAKGQA